MHFSESATWGFRNENLLSAYRQEFFVETTNLARTIHKVDLQNPVPLLPVFTDAAHPNRIIRMNIQRHFIPWNSLVRKMPDQMARDRSAKFPPVSLQ